MLVYKIYWPCEGVRILIMFIFIDRCVHIHRLLCSFFFTRLIIYAFSKKKDPPRGHEYWTSCDEEFTRAIDLVKYIREKYGEWFCIGVAGTYNITIFHLNPLYIYNRNR